MQHDNPARHYSSLARPGHSQRVLVAAIAVIALLVGLMPSGTALAASASLQLTLRTSFPVVNSGDWSIINLDYRCASVTNTPCQNVVVSVVLPPELSWAAGDVQTFGAGTTPSYTAATHTASWSFNSAIAAGDSGTIELRVKFPPGTTANGTIATLRGQIQASNAPTSLSNPLQITAVAQPKATADKTFVSGGVLDLPTVYNVSVCIPSGSGSLNLSNVLITDTLPTGATFVSASNGGTYSAGVVSWPAASISIGAGSLCVVRTVTVIFPSSTFTVGNQVRNTMNATATALGGATLSLSDFDVRLIQPPIPGFGFSKSGPGSAQVGDSVRYDFNVSNTGTTSLDNVNFVDDPIPAELNVTRIIAGSHNLPNTLRLAIEYKTNLNATWQAVPGSPFTSGACVAITGGGCANTLTLGGSEYITGLRYSYLDSLPYTFAATSSPSGFLATVVSTPINQVIANSATGRFDYNSITGEQTSEVRSHVILPPIPDPVGSYPVVSKAVSPSIVFAGDTITYTLTLRNDPSSAGGVNLINPMLADLLENNLIFVPGSVSVVSKPVGAPDPVFDQLANYNNTGKILLRWRWDSYNLAPNQQFVLQFKARIAPNTPAGTITNSAALVRWNNPAGEVFLKNCQNQPADTNDLNNNGNTGEALCSSTISSVNLAASARTSSLKLVMGQLDNTWTRDPLTGLTTPGGMADFQLVITNTDTIALTQLVVVDILPWVGDSGVVRFDQTRDTEWRPYLIGPVEAPAGATVYYSTQNNPCRQPDLGLSPDSTGCSAPNWSVNPPADITTVQSMKLEFGSFIFQPGDAIHVTYPMRAPVGGTPDQVAWNSFGYRARDTTSGSYLLASEPPRVGIKRGAVLPPSYGNYVWLDQNLNGLQDTGEPGVNGARVDLYRDTDGTSGPSTNDTWVGWTITGPDDSGNPGFYLFSDPAIMIANSDYYARILPPPGYGLTTANVGANDTIDSDVNPATFFTPVTNLSAGENDDTWDAGLIRDTAVGNYVWIDRNSDGIQNEPIGDGVNGVTVRLFRSNGTLVSTQTTADDAFGRSGFYLFTGLSAGDYFVEFVLPSGFTFTTRDTGSDDTLDSDADLTTGRTATFTLTTNQLDLTRDAGLVLTPGTLQLGNRVWRDLDNDGRYEPANGEIGIDGVKLNLYKDVNANGTPDAGEYAGTTTTLTYAGIPGYYQFENLAAGNYIVVVDATNFANGEPLAGMRTSTGNDPAPDPDDDVDHDDNGALASGVVRSQAITLSSGGEPAAGFDGDGSNGNQTLDFGFISGAALGDKVWFDTNSNGVQNAGEAGVPGVTVELLNNATNAVLATTTTDSQGAYGFTQLAAGTYRVRFSNFPASYSLTTRDQGADDTIDSDPNLATGETIAITLVDGQTDLTWDAGLTAALASMGDRVWKDLNRDGIQDAGEPGIQGVTVTLYDSAGNPIDSDPNTAGVQPRTTTTNASGIYSFTNLPPGDYAVGFSNFPAGYTVSPQNQGLDDTVDSDADRTTGRTTSTRLSPGENDPTWDLGLYVFASIGDRVWSDTNTDGIQDAGEPGVGGVSVSLFRPGESTPIATTSTNGSGNYRFTNLIPGDYYLEFTLPSGYKPSPQNVGADDTADSDADPVTRQTVTTTLVETEDDTTWDFGIYPVASIGDHAWLDLNADGIQDASETTGVPGVQVVLYNSGGTTINTTVTDASGNYSFTGLPLGVYSLGFIPPPSYILSPQDQGGSDTADSDVPAGTPPLKTIVTTLATGENDPSWDIGLYQPSSLGDRVWHDQNANGIQDPGEPGIVGVTVDLLDGSGNPADNPNIAGFQAYTTTTDGSGEYSFINLPPGQYIVAFGATPGFSNLSTTNAAAATNETDSDADATTRRTVVITLPSSTSDLTWDMGVYNLASLGDRVWLDTSVDGIQDAGENTTPTSIQNVTVDLWRPGDTVRFATTTTDANGIYSFTNLTPGDYYLIFTAPTGYAITRQNQGSDDALDSDASPVSGQTGIVSLQSGQNDIRWDVGIYQPATVGDYVWLDLNANGIQDAGETIGVESVFVELLQGSTVVDYTYTDASGKYLFTNLFPGNYTVRFSNLPAGYRVSPINQGADDAVDSDADVVSSLTTASFTLASGDDDRRYDLGLYQPASIGDRVWHDQNANGIQDVGEPGIANVTVKLLDGSGNPIDGDPVTAGVQPLTTTTDSTGLYSFTGLTPGQYIVEFTTPTGYNRVSQPNQGADDTVDSDIDRTTLRTTVATLTSGQNDTSWDAGFYQTATLGNFVWEDNNGNGLQDVSEPIVQGVTVNLLDGSGNPVDSDTVTPGVQALTTSTDASGLYLFTNLDPGQYQVEFILPGGYRFTYNDILSSEVTGATDANDSDANRTTGKTIVTTLVSGEDDRTWDAGLVRPATLGDFVWEDINGNGLQDGSEPVFSSVGVELLGAGRDRVVGTGDDLTISNATTDASGLYLFTNLQPGIYQVRFTRPTNYAFTSADQGADNAVDSDVPAGTFATGTTTNISLASNGDDRTWDAGLYKLLTLGDLVWNDVNNNGTFDTGESGINGVTVELYRDSNTNGSYNAGTDALVTTTTTAGGGLYQFTGLTQGEYLVVIPASNFAAAGNLHFFRSSDAGALTDTAADPDTNTNGDDNGVGATSGSPTTLVASSAITLSPNVEPTNDGDSDTYTNLSVDFGFYSLTLGNLVWNDLNNNGLFDSGTENGRNNVTVNLLYDADNNGSLTGSELSTPLTSFTTSNGGRYLFGGLRDGGHYIVEIQLPGGFVTSTGTNGSATGPYETAPSAETDTTDSDDNGTFVSGNRVRSAMVTISAAGEPTTESDTTMPTGITNPAANDSSNLAIDFGIFQRARLGNQVWYDTNGNGLQNETPLNGVTSVTVTLYTPGPDTIAGNGDDTTVATTTTDSSGVYGFDNLIPGTYYLSFSGIPSGYAITLPNVGGDDTIDSDQDPTTGRTATVTLTAGNNDTSWDLGIYKLLALGNFVWDDVNDNGLFDTGESGIAGVKVDLYQDTNTDNAYTAGTDTFVATTTTDGSGLYQFTGLTQGTYLVVIPASEFASGKPLFQHRSSTGANGAASGPYEPGLDPDTNINNDDNGTNVTGGIVVSAGVDLNPNAEPPTNGSDGDADADTNLSVDFGFFQPLSIGNLVWNDLNNNGQFDSATETGITGVRVELYRDANSNGTPEGGELVTFTSTDASGLYSFTDLIAGDYIVVIPASQFAVGQALDNYISSTGTNGAASGPYEGVLTPDVDANATDGDDNGTTSTVNSGVASLAVTLSRGAEPDLAADGDSANGNQTVDFGFFQPATLGKYVWHDQNADGIQDSGEPGIQNVAVSLYTAANSLVASTTTDASGLYTFTKLIPGDYYVQFTLPTGYDRVSPLNAAAATATTDSDAERATLKTTTTTLIAGEIDLSWDMGVYKVAKLGDYVWHDTNGNGIQDTGEPGIQGVTVTLLDASNNPVDTDPLTAGVQATATTDVSGLYLFSNLDPGQYRVEFTLPTGFVLTSNDVTSASVSGASDTNDSDADRSTRRTIITTLVSAEDDRSWDAGMVQLATIGDRVWEDLNGNGIQDTGEPGIQNVTVTLTGAGLNGNFGDGDDTTATTSTSSTGAYSFTNLQPGNYRLTFSNLPSGLTFTPRDQGSDDVQDSDADTTTGATVATTLISGESDLTWDAGLYQLLSLGNRVWEDLNNNGLFDLVESGINGVTVNLYRDADGNAVIAGGETTPVATTTTSNAGAYLFTGLVQGSYLVEVVPPSGYSSSVGTNGAASGPYEGVSTPNPVTVATDSDDNGTTASAVIRTSLFSLRPGAAPLNEADTTLPTATTDPARDENSNRTVDFGLFRPASIGDRVWLDRDGNGVQNAGEPGLVGITVQLWRSGATQPLTTTTGLSGSYSFTNLAADDYQLIFVVPPGYLVTAKDQGGDDTTDSDADPTTGQTIVTTLTPGESDLTWDVGMAFISSIGDRVWFDRNANGLQDTGEAGLPNVAVTLFSPGADHLPGGGDDTQIGVTTTDPNGFYNFTNLAQGEYFLTFTPPSGYVITSANQGSDDLADSDVNPTTYQTTVTTIAFNQVDPSWDMGLYRPVSLGDLVWNDRNNNGKVDAGEQPFGSVDVNLYRDTNGDSQPQAGELISTTTTLANGSYGFNWLVPGSYIVELPASNFATGTPLEGYRSSTGAPGTYINPNGPYEPATNANSDIDNQDHGTATGLRTISGAVILTSGQEPVTDQDVNPDTNRTVDFGLYQPAALGSIVWEDLNNNGRRDPGEPGIAGVTVILYDSTGVAVATTTTDSSGFYSFVNLAPGLYTIGFIKPTGYSFVTPDNSDDADDSDANPVTGYTSRYTLVPGDNNLTVFAGLIRNIPTAIVLQHFSAERVANGVQVRWTTTAELDTWGYVLYRSTDGTRAHAVRVSAQAIPAVGRSQGGEYRWIDTSAVASQAYTYWLEEIALDGTTSQYGPASVAAPREVPTTYVVNLPMVTR